MKEVFTDFLAHGKETTPFSVFKLVEPLLVPGEVSMTMFTPSSVLMLAAIKKRRLAPGVAYMGIPNVLQLKSDSSLSLTDIQSAWSCVAANVVKKANEEYLSHLKSGIAKDVSMEKTSQSRFIAAKLHTFGYIFNMFREAVGEMESGPERDVMEEVCRLYGLWQIEEQQGYFLKCG